MCLKVHLGKTFLEHLLFVEQYITTDVSNYGHYIGNYDNESVSDLINSFFPEKIEPFFADVQYEYRAKKFDTYAFEAYLEFTIKDDPQFDLYVSRITKDMPLTTFEYDTDFQIYTISHMLDLDGFYPADSENGERYYISRADIRHILINERDNTIIYVALGVYDGGGTHTAFLNRFFSSFNIDPAEYADRTRSTD